MTESRRKYFTIHLMFASFGSNILADTNVVKSMHCVTLLRIMAIKTMPNALRSVL